MRRLKHPTRTVVSIQQQFYLLAIAAGKNGLCQVAREADVSRSALSWAVKGRPMSRKVARKIATVLGVPVEALPFVLSTGKQKTPPNADGGLDSLAYRLVSLVEGGDQ